MKPLLFAALLPLALIHAQTTEGRLSGVITDSTGAAVPAATITARDADKGTELRVKTNAQGDYVLYPLPPGKYNIAAEAPGFRSETVSGVEVNVAAVLSRDIRLQVGDVQQSVDSTIFREQIDTARGRTPPTAVFPRRFP